MSILRVEDRPMPIVFGHIEGVAISLIVNTAKGNENSKANFEERDKVVLYWKALRFLVDSRRTVHPKTIFMTVYKMPRCFYNAKVAP